MIVGYSPACVHCCERYHKSGSYALCVVPESAPYGRIEASTVLPLLTFESCFHVTIRFILAVCRSVSRCCSSGGRGRDSGAEIESDHRYVPCMRQAIDPGAWPLHTSAGRFALPEETGARVPGGAPLCLPHPWMSAHHLCGTLPDAHACVRQAHPATSRVPHRNCLR